MGWLTRAFGGDARAPRDTDAALREALLAVLARDWERAHEMLALAVRLDSSAVEAFLALARLYRMQGEIGRAIRIHQNLLLRTDLRTRDRVTALVDLAEDFRRGGFLRRAIASYEEALAHAPRNVPALRALVRLLAEVREHERAIELARRLARLEGRDAASEEAALLVELAQNAHAEGRSDDARRALKRALKRQPRSAAAWIELGALQAERGRTKAALEAWLQAVEVDPRCGPEVYPRLEATYAALGRARDFEPFLRQQLAHRPEDAAARLALAVTLAARGETEAAVAELRPLLERDPEYLEAHCALGRILLGAKADAEAQTAYRELLGVLERQTPRGIRESTE